MIPNGIFIFLFLIFVLNSQKFEVIDEQLGNETTDEDPSNSQKVISIDELFTEPPRSPPLNKLRMENRHRNLSYFIPSFSDEDSIDRKGVLLDIFLNESYLSSAQTRALLLMVVVGIMTISLLVIIICFINLINKKSKPNKYEPINTITSLDFHKGGGGV